MLVIAADIAASLLDYRELRSNANVLISLLDDRNKSVKHIQQEIQSPSKAESTDLTAIVLEMIRNPSDFNLVTLNSVRLYACVPHPLTRKQVEKLDVLELSGMYGQGQSSSRTLISCQQQRSPRLAQHRSLHQVQHASVAPVASSLAPENAISSTRLLLEGHPENSSNIRKAERSAKLVKQGLQLLFHCEYLSLVKYVECIVPLVFVTYKSILNQLPNIVYYPGGAGSWALSSVTNILMFASLEIGSLILFYKLLQRQFAFSPLYQLAFVLETEISAVQATLFAEILILMQYELQHLGPCCLYGLEPLGNLDDLTKYCWDWFDAGADFTLRSEWLRH